MITRKDDFYNMTSERYGSEKQTIQAALYWRNGEKLEAGRLLFESLSLAEQPVWACSILATVIERTGSKSSAIKRIIQIAHDRADWTKAHEAFSEARAAVLQLENKASRTRDESLTLSQLYLAELVAKVIYNSTNPPDEFDEDSGWWILTCLENILDLINDDDFSKAIWKKIFT
jgi:hypothetical protein